LPLFPLPTTTITLNINPLRLSSAVVQKSESGHLAVVAISHGPSPLDGAFSFGRRPACRVGAWLSFNVRQEMILRLAFFFVALAASGCVGPFKKSVWSPAEVAKWYERWSHPSTVHRGIGYQGSDEAFHYFIARPIDYFVFIRIPRGQLQLEDTRPREQVSSSMLGVHYWVDPLDNFRKKQPNQTPEPTR
jgi:hypothetical protein